ncbi:SGNH/GDSL hydrolase family protein [Oceanisphaera sp. W20_SRM_FM3]|uniref:SGNH/GDSL hydrolase family protein n=1 Tax=Oceanisphaera sp. W20_SRM_FM3 TaxID=3240267 RepID=UPI003F98D19C
MRHNLPPILSTNVVPRIGRTVRCRALPGTVLLLSAVLLSSCSTPPVPQKMPVVASALMPRLKTQSTTRGHLTDYGESRLTPMATKLRDKNQQSHIIQLGDSHTAADFFTGTLRTALQQRFGNAGPGWVPPANIRGQRSAALKLGAATADQWRLTSSRLEKHANFPAGGFLLEPQTSASHLQLAQYTPSNTAFNVRALYRSSNKAAVRMNGQSVSWAASNSWQWSPAEQVRLPLTLQVQAETLQLGGWLVENGKPGVMVSSIGINGATIHMLDKWGPNWQASVQALQPDLLILAYGTNEAFNDDLESAAYYASLTRHIKQLRAQLPETALLMVGAPDVIKHAGANTCQARRPVQLNTVQAIQRQVAREQHTLFWDWQAMMGGACSFSQWQAKGLARKDGVHFSAEGYTASAIGLYRDLEQLLSTR